MNTTGFLPSEVLLYGLPRRIVVTCPYFCLEAVGQMTLGRAMCEQVRDIGKQWLLGAEGALE